MRIIPLRRNGLRLARSEWPSAVAGELRIVDVPGTQTNYKRAVRVAEVWEVGLQSSRQALHPIADVELVGAVEGGLLIAGTELAVQEGRIREYRQLWLCLPAGVR